MLNFSHGIEFASTLRFGVHGVLLAAAVLHKQEPSGARKTSTNLDGTGCPEVSHSGQTADDAPDASLVPLQRAVGWWHATGGQRAAAPGACLVRGFDAVGSAEVEAARPAPTSVASRWP